MPFITASINSPWPGQKAVTPKRFFALRKFSMTYEGVRFTKSTLLEPISKLLEKHGDASELDKSEEVGGVVFPANQ
jgi:hypothetical protein